MTAETTEAVAADRSLDQKNDQNNDPKKPDPQPAIQQYTDGSTYEIPRPFLTLEQAAAVLGKSMRALERSLLGRWGNKLPDGWVARKLRLDEGEEWRILPPPGFRIRQSVGAESDTTAGAEMETVQDEYISLQEGDGTRRRAPSSPRRFWPGNQSRHTVEQPTIVIDRSEEVEHLLRELVASQRALAEERRHHMEDMRLIQQLQSSVKLLEVDAAEKAKTKSQLEQTADELKKLQAEYEKLLKMPWWQRLFKGQP